MDLTIKWKSEHRQSEHVPHGTRPVSHGAGGAQTHYSVTFNIHVVICKQLCSKLVSFLTTFSDCYAMGGHPNANMIEPIGGTSHHMNTAAA